MQRLRHAMLAIIVCAPFGPVWAAVDAPAQADALRAAFRSAKSATLSEAERDGLRRNPLLPWLDAIQFKQQIQQQDGARALALVEADPDAPVSRWLIGQWRTELIRRKDWPATAAWLVRFPDDSAGSRCAQLLAREPDARDDAWRQNALALWITEVKPPGHCDALFAALRQSGALGDAQIWQRFDRLLAENEVAAMKALPAYLSPPAAALANAYLAFLAAPVRDAALSWPADARSRAVLSQGLRGAARSNPEQMQALVQSLPPGLALSPEQRAAVLSEIALWSLVENLPQAEARYLAVPEAMRSANLREWYLRWQFGRNQPEAALAAYAQLLPAQQQEARWQYLKARNLELAGQRAQALPLYRQAADSASFHGWLAADRIGAAYTFCPLQPEADPAQQRKLRQNPGLQRALWLWQLGEANYAIWEWNAAFETLTDNEKLLAIGMAQAVAWYDRAVFSMPEGERFLRYYSLRFATPYGTDFDAAARRFDLDRSWLTAHARAESIFMPGVTSSANARGLLQLLPSTAESIAMRNGIAWQGAESLYQPGINILLGAGALRDVVDTFQGLAYRAIAAYNAGPTAVNRWLGLRPELPPEFWIESIPYKETREYVPRVLAFSVIYDWRLDRPVRPISQRLLGDFNAPFKPVALQCPAPAPVAAPAGKARKKRR